MAREILQAKIALEAQQLKSAAIAPCCPDTRVRVIHARTLSPQRLVGAVHIPVHTFQCSGCEVFFRPDDRHVDVPEVEVGDFIDNVRALYAPVVA